MKKQAIFISKNFIRMLILLFFVSIAAFALVSMAPLDPLQTNVGQAAMGSMSPEQIERLRLYWGEGIPPLKRYLAWAGDFIRGNMGISLLYHQPVAKVIQVRFASSVWLMAAAWILSGVTGVILGMTAGARKGSLTDRVISAYALVTASTPAFWVALVLLMVFAVWLKVLPVGFSHRRRCSHRFYSRPHPSWYIAGSGFKSYRHFQYHPPYQGENDPGYGK